MDRRGLRHDVIWARWWTEAPATLRELAFIDDDQRDLVPDLPLPLGYRPTAIEGRPVFVGHYWMGGEPRPFSPKVACVDWSAARGQPLVAYRWDGERMLTAAHFISSEASVAPVRHSAAVEYA